MAQSFKNLPPNVRRELLRHVGPPTKGKAAPGGAATPGQDEKSSKMRNVLFACIGFTTVMGTVPFIAHYAIPPLNSREGPLTSAQVRRGAFLNSGSRDMGRDENWDFENNRSKIPVGYGDAGNNVKSIVTPGGRSISNEDEEKLRALAEGRRSQAGQDGR
jgi:hypothetical protein